MPHDAVDEGHHCEFFQNPASISKYLSDWSYERDPFAFYLLVLFILPMNTKGKRVSDACVSCIESICRGIPSLVYNIASER